jgi:hypothetical protein
MTALNRYIAVFIAWVFLFPVLSQPWHIVYHHSHERSDHACEHNHHHAEEPEDEEATLFHNTHDNCQICDYKFPVIDSPDSYYPVFEPYQYNEVYAELTPSYYQTTGFLQINPRAPPKS